jgi:hypothetical protein
MAHSNTTPDHHKRKRCEAKLRPHTRRKRFKRTWKHSKRLRKRLRKFVVILYAAALVFNVFTGHGVLDLVGLNPFPSPPQAPIQSATYPPAPTSGSAAPFIHR